MHGFAGRRIYPTKAIIPGCTWATLIVRAYMMPYADALLGSVKRLIADHRLQVVFILAIYIDDLTATTSGPRGEVAT